MSDRWSSSAVLDEYLVSQSRRGDARAFSRLVRRWHPRLLRHAHGYTRDMEAARDVTQEAWMAVIRELGSLRDPARFRSWAFRIVANKARDWVRHEQARRRAMRGAAEEESDAPGSPWTGMMGELRDALELLESGQRRILTRYYLDDMSVREIAEALGVPRGTVKSRLFYARSALRAALEEG